MPKIDPPKRYFLDITPMLSTAQGNTVTLGTVRYEVSEHQIGNPTETVYHTSTQWLHTGSYGVPAEVVFMVSIRPTDVPQPQSLPLGEVPS